MSDIHNSFEKWLQENKSPSLKLSDSKRIWAKQAYMAGVNEAYERAVQYLDNEVDRLEKIWKEHLASGAGGPATSHHERIRSLAQAIWDMKGK